MRFGASRENSTVMHARLGRRTVLLERDRCLSPWSSALLNYGLQFAGTPALSPAQPRRIPGRPCRPMLKPIPKNRLVPSADVDNFKRCTRGRGRLVFPGIRMAHRARRQRWAKLSSPENLLCWKPDDPFWKPIPAAPSWSEVIEVTHVQKRPSQAAMTGR